MNIEQIATDRSRVVDLGGGVGAAIKIEGSRSGGALAVVEHPLAPGALIEPHVHTREDEYSIVIQGEVGFLLGDGEFTASPGTGVVKPRGVLHAAWNPSAAPARFLEIVSPAGFERFFYEIAELFARPAPPEADELEELSRRYGLSFELSRANDLIERYGLDAAVRYG